MSTVTWFILFNIYIKLTPTVQKFRHGGRQFYPDILKHQINWYHKGHYFKVTCLMCSAQMVQNNNHLHWWYN
jgi:hypothetical protein